MLRVKLKSGPHEQSFDDHSFRLSAVFNLLDQDRLLEDYVDRRIAYSLECHEVPKILLTE